jgi:hypothetical protein
MASIHNNFGVSHHQGTQHHAKPASVAHQSVHDTEIHDPKDSTASFSAAVSAEHYHEVAPDHTAEVGSKSAAPRSEEAALARPSFSSSPLKMGELGEVHGIDLNGPDRLHEARIDGLNGIYSTKLVGLSGQTLANLNPLGH